MCGRTSLWSSLSAHADLPVATALRAMPFLSAMLAMSCQLPLCLNAIVTGTVSSVLANS
jgi:hypothetical protein